MKRIAVATLLVICGASLAPAFAGSYGRGRGGTHGGGDPGPRRRVNASEPPRLPPAALFYPAPEPVYFRRAARDRDKS